MSWGRILVFFYFAVRFFLRNVDRAVRFLIDFCSSIVKALNDICAMGIFQWIADHGGWVWENYLNKQLNPSESPRRQHVLYAYISHDSSENLHNDSDSVTSYYQLIHM